MKLRVVALGHRMPAWVSAGFGDYAKRLPREWKLDLVELKPEARDRGRSVAQTLAVEATRIATVATGYRLVALDEHGTAWTTREFARQLRTWQEAAQDVAFVVGSADGVHAGVKAHASAVVALSAMTLPHGLARVILIEQIYRAASLLGGHPYHRE